HDSADIPENMDEQSVRKQLAQATDVERVFWRSIHPTSFGARWCTGGFEPTRVDFQLRTGLAVSFQVLAMAQNQLVDASTKHSEQFISSNVHRAQDRVNPARSANLVGDGDIDSEVPHPI